MLLLAAREPNKVDLNTNGVSYSIRHWSYVLEFLQLIDEQRKRGRTYVLRVMGVLFDVLSFIDFLTV